MEYGSFCPFLFVLVSVLLSASVERFSVFLMRQTKVKADASNELQYRRAKVAKKQDMCNNKKMVEKLRFEINIIATHR